MSALSEPSIKRVGLLCNHLFRPQMALPPSPGLHPPAHPALPPPRPCQLNLPGMMMFTNLLILGLSGTCRQVLSTCRQVLKYHVITLRQSGAGGRQAWQGLAQAMGFPAVQTASKTAHPFSRKVLPCPHPPRSRAVKRAFHARRRRCPAWAGASQEPGDRWSRAGDWQPGSSPACLGSARCERTEFTCFNLTQCSQHTQMHRQMLRSTRRCARYASFELLGQR